MRISVYRCIVHSTAKTVSGIQNTILNIWVQKFGKVGFHYSVDAEGISGWLNKRIHRNCRGRWKVRKRRIFELRTLSLKWRFNEYVNFPEMITQDPL